MSPFVIVLSGMSLAGKTTLGKALEKSLGVPMLGVDKARQELSADTSWLGADREKEIMRAAYILNHQKAEKQLMAGQSVILVATYSRPEYHEAVRNLVEFTGAQLYAYYLQIPDELISTRLLQRNLEGSDSNVKTMEAFLEQRDRYQKMGGAKQLDGGMPVEDLVQRIRRDVIDS